MKISFEIKDKDIAGRIGNLEIKDENKGISKIIETPTLMPVYGLNNPILSIDELKEKFNAKILMTNAYVLFKSPDKNKVIEQGIHKFLNFDGIIAVDSGSYQLMKYGDIDMSNSEILKFEEGIGAEIGSFLDIPTLPDAYKKIADENLAVTLKRAKEAKELNLDMMINAAIQGGTFMDLRAKAAREISKSYDLNAIGGIVRLMEEYRFEELIDIIVAAKKNIRASNVVHAFGLGHPMLFGLAVAWDVIFLILLLMPYSQKIKGILQITEQRKFQNLNICHALVWYAAIKILLIWTSMPSPYTIYMYLMKKSEGLSRQ